MLGYVRSSHVTLTFGCLSDFYRRFVEKPSQIAAPFTSMLKTLKSTEFTTRPRKGGVEVGGDGGETLISRLRTSLSTDSSTSATLIVVEFDEVNTDGDTIDKSVKKLSKSQRIVKSRKTSKV